jgi:hypothetical protein
MMCARRTSRARARRIANLLSPATGPREPRRALRRCAYAGTWAGGRSGRRGAGGRGENRGGGSGVSICPQKLSLWDATKERMAASPGGGGVVVLRRIKWAEKNDNAQPYSAVRMGRHDTKHVQGWGVVTQSAERRHGWQAAGMARRTQRGAGGRHLQHPVQGRA